jgi:hypothetical protein
MSSPFVKGGERDRPPAPGGGSLLRPAPGPAPGVAAGGGHGVRTTPRRPARPSIRVMPLSPPNPTGGCQKMSPDRKALVFPRSDSGVPAGRRAPCQPSRDRARSFPSASGGRPAAPSAGAPANQGRAARPAPRSAPARRGAGCPVSRGRRRTGHPGPPAARPPPAPAQRRRRPRWPRRPPGPRRLAPTERPVRGPHRRPGPAVTVTVALPA